MSLPSADGGRPRINPMIFIAGVSFMNAVAGMIVIPVLPRLIVGFTGDTASAAHYVGLFAALFALRRAQEGRQLERGLDLAAANEASVLQLRTRGADRFERQAA